MPERERGDTDRAPPGGDPVPSPLSLSQCASSADLHPLPRAVPAAPESQTQVLVAPAPVAKSAPSDRPPVLPGTMTRLAVARQRIHEMATGGTRIRTYEIALDLDMSEFHFARQFRLAFDRSPHVYYDEVRAETARAMLASGLPEGTVARRIGFRRPAELRALLSKRAAGTLPASLG